MTTKLCPMGLYLLFLAIAVVYGLRGCHYGPSFLKKRSKKLLLILVCIVVSFQRLTARENTSLHLTHIPVVMRCISCQRTTQPRRPWVKPGARFYGLTTGAFAPRSSLHQNPSPQAIPYYSQGEESTGRSVCVSYSKATIAADNSITVNRPGITEGCTIICLTTTYPLRYNVN